ncbi:photosystem II 5 kDa protein, chloroplastic-like [Malus sylvestris]|uniref:photosystem II 5 kDa protein, chloroplastic-like n=1 Tax=Malus sylvestris TaxID=3752 RepID=UPI0021ACAED2|nr:photosystem II 5 kDa protein, chloroplastic-like [Malus sylvestris]
MASMTMTAASFLTAGSASTIAKPSTSSRRSLVVAKAAARTSEGETKKEGSSNSSGRRDLMFAAAAAVASSLAKAALADEPKRGTKEAKEKYAPVCVTMPTARICRN